MAEKYLRDPELAWEMMSNIEKAVWGTTLALHAGDEDAGQGAADAALVKLRDMAGLRSRHPEPEYEAAKANIPMEYEEFAVWYSVAYRIWHDKSAGGAEPPTSDETKGAYGRYQMCRCDFY